MKKNNVMITPEEYAKKCEEYRDRIWEVEKERTALDARIADLEAERASFREKYVRDALERSGYMVGQQLKDENGKIWFVTGAREQFNQVVLNLNPVKKDGTMSKTTYIARGEPCIVIN